MGKDVNMSRQMEIASVTLCEHVLSRDVEEINEVVLPLPTLPPPPQHLAVGQ